MLEAGADHRSSGLGRVAMPPDVLRNDKPEIAFAFLFAREIAGANETHDAPDQSRLFGPARKHAIEIVARVGHAARSMEHEAGDVRIGSVGVNRVEVAWNEVPQREMGGVKREAQRQKGLSAKRVDSGA